tara:strand:+ start:76 stop:510 length:435 start_codon:yes stop_codon:yes gene_type:complete
MTTGQFIYSSRGKQFKIFGPHDSDGLKLLKNRLNIIFISADKRGFSISKKRIKDHMGYNINLVSEEDRYQFLSKKFGIKNIIYMGDGIYDANILKDCFYGIAPKNARIEAKKSSNYITKSKSAEGAVLDACLHIKKKFFKKITK